MKYPFILRVTFGKPPSINRKLPPTTVPQTPPCSLSQWTWHICKISCEAEDQSRSCYITAQTQSSTPPHPTPPKSRSKGARGSISQNPAPQQARCGCQEAQQITLPLKPPNKEHSTTLYRVSEHSLTPCAPDRTPGRGCTGAVDWSIMSPQWSLHNCFLLNK